MTSPKATILATKLDTLKLWQFTHGNLTYLASTVVGSDGPKWRTIFGVKKLMDKLEAISSNDKDAETKAKMSSAAYLSLTAPCKNIPGVVQLGGTLQDDKVEEVKQEDGSVKEVVVAVKSKNFPSAKGTVK